MPKNTINYEKKILHLSLDEFRRNFPNAGPIKIIDQNENRKDSFRLDYRIRMLIDGRLREYHSEIKANFTKTDELLLKMKSAKLNAPVLLISKYINPEMAETLRNDGLEFLDTAGNAFINKPPIFIFIKGQKPKVEITKPLGARRNKPAGLKILFYLLCNPRFENESYRNISEAANVALGSVGWIMKELREQGFLIGIGKGRFKLIQKERLFHQWIEAYPGQLRPKQLLGRYNGERDWWKNVALDGNRAQWGGEVAAARLTGYLKPESVTIYCDPDYVHQLLLENRLYKDDHGEIEVLAKFWKTAETKVPDQTVHPILIYADLLAAGNQRNVETAKLIYERHIIQLIA